MKIFVSAMAFDNGKSGISNYIYNVVRELAKNAEIELAVLVSDAKYFEGIEGIKLIKYPDFFGAPGFNALWHLFVLPLQPAAGKCDFIFLPAANRRLFSWFSRPSVVTFHDLSQFHVSEKYDTLRTWYVFKFLRKFLNKADKICAISKSTENDIRKYYNIDQGKIFVNYNGFERDRLDVEYSPEKLAELKVEPPYILYLSRIEHPGKNHLNLIKAFELLDDYYSEYQLVFVGSDWSGARAVREAAERSEKKERINFLGFVEDSCLPHLYKGASVYAFPSFCEGFGIPLLEAMYCCVPCVCSKGTSLEEIGGDAVLVFDPKNPNEIAEKIEMAIKDENLSKSLIEKGKDRIEDFSWEKHADTLLEQFSSIRSGR
ncbi:N-acetylgalactosamine-N,N'-diacetylbacillosaminyl-diphospho-undecaprenol 4-alpha-N-acetylgalactosaminyltransferase [Sedimentisphaera cyanobacteriorum]|uniref:N-acetylgalactosamine-N, N'-diacetylbacillosaminyl-diphospho-undecaprenol 4-alpha-N-acetylgalactosaminyltransferase n=1 Tax=Sedimentisphaera cyanobacteriorum TaxID=1940790 RepID=A0A1Q2HNL6_9BACT|nr:glycosyltransferase family 1 protein [Sedimentisphaera cyanobacteriorum]AQQ08950.1 N-acetylgalactosamine-N,N'-diacetylbacillosaminyl-diphospho-undecaprenol 4-alpha-N-acetylgalactosaminyltransferase [Sedimentisphaera cyanobacteriorum]